MTKLINNHVVFSFDDNNDLHASAKFYRWIDGLNALQKLTYKPALGTGMWCGYLEPCVMMDYNDFMKFVYHSDLVKNQQCFLQLSPRARSVAYDGFLFGHYHIESPYQGKWTRVLEDEAYNNRAYSHFGDEYFVCTKD